MFKTSLLRSDTQLNQQSYYEASVSRPAELAPLQGELRADVLVVGGGFAGLSRDRKSTRLNSSHH